MDSIAAVRLPYNSFRRRLRRRYPRPTFIYFAALLGAVPCLAGLAWLLRGEGWAGAAEATRWLWFGGCSAGALVVLLGLVLGAWAPSSVKGTRSGPGRAPGIPLANFVRQFLIWLAAAASLLVGRTDWAILTWYGGSCLNGAWHIVRFRGHTWRDAARLAPQALLGLAILPGWPELFAAAGVLSLVWPVLLRPSLFKLVNEKRDRWEFVRHEQEECG